MFIHKSLKRNIHTNIKFTKLIKISKRKLRSHRASLLVLPKTRTNYGKTMITFEGSQFYNKIPSNVKNVNSLNLFKLHLAKYIKSTF